MMSIEAMSGAGQGSYYIDLAREDYYLEGGEPPGRWFGRGAELLGLSDTVQKEEFRHVLQGYSPDGQNELVQNAGKENRQSGWDVTFSAPKSVSTIWSQADNEMRQEIQEAHGEAVKAALSYLEDNAAFTRRGKGGLEKEEAGLVVATFEHGTSRAQDPQLHTHALVLNTGTRADGSTGTIESKPLYQHKMAAGAIYRAELASQLEQRLGFEIEREKFSFTVTGVDKGLIDEFSTRRKEIEEALSEKGFSSSKAASVAALNTREVKDHIPRDTLFERWKSIGQEFGWSTDQARELCKDCKPEKDMGNEAGTAIQTAVRRITDHDNTFTKRDLVRFTAEESQGKGLGAKDILSVVGDTLKTSPDIVSLGRVGDDIRYTTREILELETKMMSAAERLNASEVKAVKTETVQSVLSKRETFSEEQTKAVRHITETPGRIKAVSGMAGTGKSFSLATAREIWEQDGFQVIGAALSGKAAQGLEEGAGIKSETIHNTLFDLREEKLELSSKSIVVVDEAGMVGTRQMNELIRYVEKQEAKIVLVGDAKQLQPVDAGGPFKAISEKIGFVELTEIRRQREEWAREAVQRIARGEASEMLTSFAEKGQLFVGKDRVELLDQAFQDWKREGVESPKDHLILAATNQDIRKLNDRAQQERFSANKLGSEKMRINSQTIFEGDRVLFTRNSRMFGVKNGSLGTVEKLNREEQILTARLDSGERVSIELEHYDHVRLGYAVTTHKSQGMTVENTYVVLGGGMQDRELSYVQASRAREKTRLYAEEGEAGDKLKELSKQMSQSHQKGLAIEHQREPQMKRQLKQSQEIGM